MIIIVGSIMAKGVQEDTETTDVSPSPFGGCVLDFKQW